MEHHGEDNEDRRFDTRSAAGSRRFLRFLRTGDAVSAIEYAVLVGIVVVALTAALNAFQNEIAQALSRASALVTSAPGLTP